MEDWDPEFNRIPMKKIAKKGGKRSGMAAKNWFVSHSGEEGYAVRSHGHRSIFCLVQMLL